VRLAEPLTVWRLAAARHADRAFDGEGARLYGGRWNHPGVPVVYTSATLSLAALELFVHLDAEDVPEDRIAIPAEVPRGLDVEELRAEDLPAAWRSYPALEALKELGTAWARSRRTAVLQVPSAVIPAESNYLINPLHPQVSRITVREPAPFTFDRRLSKSG
jgi:RES domain-containing protein